MKQYKKITKQISGIYLIKILEFVLMFVLFIVLTRVLTIYEFGIYSILNVSILLIGGVLGFGMPEFIVRDLAGEEKEAKKKKFSQIIMFGFFVAISTAIIFVPLAYVFLGYMNYGGIFFATTMAILCACGLIIGNMLNGYFYSEKQSAKNILADSLLNSLWVLPILIIATFLSININNIFTIKLIFAVLVVIIIFVYLKKKGVLVKAKIEKDYIRKALFFGLPLATIAVSQWMITAVDRYVIGIFHSPVEVGNYSYIYSLLNFVLVLCTYSVSKALYPYAVESYNNKDGKKSNFFINSVLKYNIMLTLPALAGFFILRREIVTLLSGTNYLVAVPIVPFLLLFPLMEGVFISFKYMLLLKKKTKVIGKVYIIGMIMNLVLNFILIPKYSYYGAAIATSITYLMMAIMFVIEAKNYFKIDWVYLRLIRIILSTAIMGVAIYFIQPQEVFGKIVTISLGVLVYAFSLFISKSFVKEEIALMKSFLSKKKK